MRRASLLVLWIVGAILLAAPFSCAQTLEDKVQEFTLDNGMKFLVVERHEAPTFFGAIAFRVGSIHERPGITGISHLLEHMLFKGTETVGTTDYEKERGFLEREDAIAAEMDAIEAELGLWRIDRFGEYVAEIISSFSDEDREVVGADRALELDLLIERLVADGPSDDLLAVTGLIEADGVNYFDRFVDLKRKEMELQDEMAEHRELIVSNEFWETYMNNGSRMLNAGTSYDGTFYFAALPSNRLELWMLMESDRMANSTFREFYSEKEVVMEERRMSENEPEDVLYEAFMSTAYSACPYKNPILGWMSDIEHTTRQDLADYYRARYGPNNATAIVVGDIDFDDVRDLARKYFGSIERGEDLPYVTTDEPKQQGERRLVVRQDAKPTLMIGYHIPRAPHPDSFVLEVMDAVLSQGRVSRFYRHIYEEKGLTRGAPSSWIGPGNMLDPLFMLGADPQSPHTLEEVEAALLEELEILKDEPVSMRELERIWNSNDAELVRAMQSNYGIAFNVGFYHVMRGDWRLIYDDMERMRQVTPEDIMRVAQTYFTEENRTVGWLVETESDEGEGDEDEIDLQELMMWVQTLPQEERQDLMNRFMSLDEQGREALAVELWERMQAEKGRS